MATAKSFQMATAQRRREIHSKWCALHPERAAEQRALRIEQRDALSRHAKTSQSTPETKHHARRTRQGALARLYASGSIAIEQLGWALEIAAVAERIGADVAVRTVSLEARIDHGRSGDAAFFEALGAVRAEWAYSRWREALPYPAAPILDMIVGDVGVTVAAQRYHMHVRRARGLLLQSLDLWPGFYDLAVKKIDPAELLAAQAGLL